MVRVDQQGRRQGQRAADADHLLDARSQKPRIEIQRRLTVVGNERVRKALNDVALAVCKDRPRHLVRHDAAHPYRGDAEAEV